MLYIFWHIQSSSCKCFLWSNLPFSQRRSWGRGRVPRCCPESESRATPLGLLRGILTIGASLLSSSFLDFCLCGCCDRHWAKQATCMVSTLWTLATRDRPRWWDGVTGHVCKQWEYEILLCKRLMDWEDQRRGGPSNVSVERTVDPCSDCH